MKRVWKKAFFGHGWTRMNTDKKILGREAYCTSRIIARGGDPFGNKPVV
jgi:hypothetical protein